MYFTVFTDISLSFVQLGLENFGKIVRDPPIYHLLENRVFLLQTRMGKSFVRGEKVKYTKALTKPSVGLTKVYLFAMHKIYFWNKLGIRKR